MTFIVICLIVAATWLALSAIGAPHAGEADMLARMQAHVGQWVVMRLKRRSFEGVIIGKVREATCDGFTLETLGGATEFYNVSPSEIVALTTLPDAQQAQINHEQKFTVPEPIKPAPTATAWQRGEQGH